MNVRIPLGILLVLSGTHPLASQENRAALEGILRAEDRRARSAADSSFLVGALASGDTLVLHLGIRALGRLERSGFALALLPLLGHPLPGIRAEAAQAVAQAAQGFRAEGFPVTGRAAPWDGLLAALAERVTLEHDPAVRGVLALSLGRLPYGSLEEIAVARAALLTLADGLSGAPLLAGVRGIALHLRLTARRSPLPEALRARLVALARDADAAVARAALGALLAAQAADGALLETLSGSKDAELRRLVQSGSGRLPAGAARDRLLEAGLADPVSRVRVEALTALGRSAGTAGCPALARGAHDSALTVSLVALDLLGGCTGDNSVALLLAGVASGSPDGWWAPAHALLSLARVAPLRAAALLPAVAQAAPWQVRMYAARTAGLLRDSTMLRRLAADPVPNVREAALARLAPLTGHADDARYRAALAGTDSQLLLTAAGALAGSPERAAGSRAVLAALDRLTRARRETSRDPRVALLTRLRELGTPSQSPRLRPYLADFDPVIAESAAAVLASWTGHAEAATPRPLPVPVVALAEVERLRGASLRVTLEGGSGFTVSLLADAAPLTVARVARLVARGAYDGLTWHRVVANFVIQGGSPGANEYSGHDPYLRDELGPASHERGTLGISTRGRDTGDGQWFINLVDNPRLDYEYTVWGLVSDGLAVVDALQEGARIRRVTLRQR